MIYTNPTVTRSQERMFRGARLRREQDRVASQVIDKVLAEDAAADALRAEAHALAVANLHKPWARRYLRSRGRFV